MNNYNLKSKFIKQSPKTRRYNLQRPIIAITGGIGTGKSTACNYLQQKGFEIFDADQMVKDIYTFDETKNFISKLSPESVQDGKINFESLRNAFYNSEELKLKIESYLYEHLEKLFLSKEKQLTQSFVVYDVPLLFEKNIHEQVDLSLLIYSPKELQISRVKSRDQLSDDQIQRILSAQIDIEQKRKLSDFCIENIGSLEKLHQQIDHFIDEVFD